MLRITMNPAYLTERLLELGWDAKNIQIVYDRLIKIAEEDEDYVSVARRLNPQIKKREPRWSFETARARERAYRESPELDPRLSALVRDARNRLNI